MGKYCWLSRSSSQTFRHSTVNIYKAFEGFISGLLLQTFWCSTSTYMNHLSMSLHQVDTQHCNENTWRESLHRVIRQCHWHQMRGQSKSATHTNYAKTFSFSRVFSYWKVTMKYLRIVLTGPSASPGLTLKDYRLTLRGTRRLGTWFTVRNCRTEYFSALSNYTEELLLKLNLNASLQHFTNVAHCTTG